VATSGAVSFSPDVGELVEEAYERAGLQMVSGYDLRTARRSLDLMLMEWANRGINLWCVEEHTQDLSRQRWSVYCGQHVLQGCRFDTRRDLEN
jgi:hypothetical protein